MEEGLLLVCVKVHHGRVFWFASLFRDIITTVAAFLVIPRLECRPMVLTQCDFCPVRSSLVLTQCEFCPEPVLSYCGVEWTHVW